jgi:hypothetical protein
MVDCIDFRFAGSVSAEISGSWLVSISRKPLLERRRLLALNGRPIFAGTRRERTADVKQYVEAKQLGSGVVAGGGRNRGGGGLFGAMMGGLFGRR